MQTLGKISQFFGNTFGVWVIIFSILAFFQPEWFTGITSIIVPLLGIVMFGMGLTLTPKDFSEVFRRPLDVAIGVGAQFTIMPLVAFALAYGFSLPPELAVGVILVGCCPGGTASNVMTYLSKGDTALSVSITSVSTVIAPILTPTLIWLLASQWLPVSASDLFLTIFKVIIIPIGLGIMARLIFGHIVDSSIKVLPLVSVTAIVAIVAGVVATSKENLVSTGVTVFAIVILHNLFGLALGYYLAKLLKVSESKRKAVSIEVGMQNSALGATLATLHFNPIAAIPSAIFSVWHNLSGPVLATYWSRKAQDRSKQQDTEQTSTL
ncbi:bile acid:sodium symporter family protein [Caldalkalibacillus salinus]|uniref:bile acid:sodium symporter family protein n=1 Tax=Caldalkalibacillus salinus TaxID=2803787 RepID=UPI0019206A54|nr:bile acid:sodium symporter family protein [Caldalkalibacillus salinus]